MVLEKNPRTRPIVRKLLKLEDGISGLPFPKMARIKQIDIYSCGPAVLAALYSNLGVRVSQRGLIASLRAQNKIKKYGLSVKDLARASKIVGKGAFAFWKKSGARINDLDKIVNQYKCPVAVEWQGVFYEFEDEDSGHYAVITKVDKKSGFLRISDPFHAFAGVDRKFKIHDFEKRWWDFNEISVSGTSKKRRVKDIRVMFVITPKGESWPKVLGMNRA
jgi:predicted double-glycine peptidase